MTIVEISQWTADYGIWVLLPIAIIEGPIATVIAGFMVSLGKVSPFVVYAIVVLGDILGDALMYVLGRWFYRHVERFGKWIGMTEEKKKRVTDFFLAHERKALVFSKVAHGIGITGLLTAGALRIPYRRYALMCGIVSVVQALLFFGIGYFFGHAAQQIAGVFKEVAVLGSMVFCVVLFLVLRKIFFPPIESYDTN